MLQQPHVARTTFFPLPGSAIELEQLGAHLEELLLLVFGLLDLDFLGQMDHRLEVNIRLLLVGLIVLKNMSCELVNGSRQPMGIETGRF